MVVLVSGATGLVGTATVDALNAAGHEVVTIGRRPATGASGWVQQDLTRPLDTSSLPDRLDAVVHLARHANLRDVPSAAPQIHMIDSAAAVSLATAGLERGAQSFVYASSGAARDAGTDPGSPLAFYSAVKRATELLLESYGPRLGLAVLRLYYPFGASHPCFVRDLALGIRAGHTVRLGGKDGLTLNPIGVADAAACILPALERPGVYDVAGPEEVSLRELAERLGTALGIRPVFEHDPAAPQHRQVGNHDQLRGLLGRGAAGLSEALGDLTARLDR